MSRMISLISQEFTRLITPIKEPRQVLLRKFSEFSEFQFSKIDRKHILHSMERFTHLDFTDFTFIHKCLAANCFHIVKSIFHDFTVISMHYHRIVTVFNRNKLYKLFSVMPVDMSDMFRLCMNHVHQCISDHAHGMFDLLSTCFTAWNRLKTLYNALSVGMSGACVTCMNHVHQRISNQIHGMFYLISNYFTRWNSLKTLYIVCPVDTTDMFGICSNTTCQCSTDHLSICPPCISVMKEV